MSISYAGVPLLLHDPQGELAAYIEQYLAEHATNWFGRRSPSEKSLKQISIQRHPARVPMPTFNWPAPPKPRINTIYNPVTGATRWAVGLFLVTGDGLPAILKATENGAASAQLAITDDRSGATARTAKIQAAMYPLMPRFVAGSDPALYILPLVDVRYFWQFSDAGTLSVTAGTSWADLISALTSRLAGEAISSGAVPGSYFGPDPIECSRPYQNAVQLLDAAAASTGCRIVFDVFRTFARIQGPTEAAGAFADQKGDYDMIGGGTAGTAAGNIPEGIRILFPEHVGHIPAGGGGLYAVNKGPSSSATEPSGTAWDIFSTAAADLTGHGSGSTPNNNSDLGTLATQIAADLYAWWGPAYDLTVAGNWTYPANGFEDYHLIDLRGTIQTRIATLPPNVGPHTNWCQVPGASVAVGGGTGSDTRANVPWPAPRLRVELTETLTSGGSATAKPIYILPDGTITYDANTVTVYDPLSKVSGSLPSGTQGDATFFPDDGRWEIDELAGMSGASSGVTYGDWTVASSDGITFTLGTDTYSSNTAGSDLTLSGATIQINSPGTYRVEWRWQMFGLTSSTVSNNEYALAINLDSNLLDEWNGFLATNPVFGGYVSGICARTFVLASDRAFPAVISFFAVIGTAITISTPGFSGHVEIFKLA